jgi:hypothetical protein
MSMRRVLYILICTVSLWGYGVDGTWVNDSRPERGFPKYLIVDGNRVSAVVKSEHAGERLSGRSCISVKGVMVGIWKRRRSDLLLVIYPVGRDRLEIVAKRVFHDGRRDITRRYRFSRSGKRGGDVWRFAGEWYNDDRYSGSVRRLSIVVGKFVNVKAWRDCRGGECLMGGANARYENGKLLMRFYSGDRHIEAVITGVRSGGMDEKYSEIKLSLKSRDRRGTLNREVIHLRRR